MKLYLSIFLVIFLFSIEIKSICISRSSGAECDPNSYSSCPLGYYCNDQACHRLKENGEDCEYDFQCQNHLSCSENKCISNKYLGIGETCKGNTECTYGLFCNSTTNVCTNPNYPSCKATDSCSPNEFCDRDDFICKTKIKENQECFRHHFGNCEHGLECNLINSESATCQKLFSRQEGDFCQSFISCDISKGLLCSLDDSKCRVYVPTVLPVNASCETSGCTSGVEGCFCDPLRVGQSMCKSFINYNDKCKEARETLEECKKINQCPDVYNYNDAKSCYRTKCGVTIDQYQLNCFN